MPTTKPVSTPLGTLLRQWRDTRGRSQLALSLDMGVSQRHISFVESGRSVPSRALLLGIANALDVPLRDRNALLLAAGYAPMYAEVAWDAAEMRVVHRALERMLKQQEPYPALVMNRHWNVLMTNEAAPKFFGQFISLGKFPRPRNLLRLMFDPKGLRPFVANWEHVAASPVPADSPRSGGWGAGSGDAGLGRGTCGVSGCGSGVAERGAIEQFAGGADRVRQEGARVELVLDGEHSRDAADRSGAGVKSGMYVS